jgi:L,D-transpeptidase YcbB
MLSHILNRNQQYTFRSVYLLLLIGLLFLQSCKTTTNWELSQLEPIEAHKIKHKARSKNLKKIKVTPHINDLKLPEEDIEMLESFYSLNAGHLAWFKNKRLSKNVNQLLHNLGMAWADGLPMEKYPTGSIYEAFSQLKSLSKDDASYPELYAQLDIMLTHLYFQYATDLYSGNVKPQLLGDGWDAAKPALDLPQVLLAALRQLRVDESLEALKPKNDSYKLLSQNLVRLIFLRDEGGWEVPAVSETQQSGDSSGEVVRIKKFLQKTGDLHQIDSSYIHNQLFDQTLEMAVKSFQKRHGLEADGIAGKNTLEQMNHSIDYRIGQIRANLERMRWVPENEDHYILVNIPEFKLRYYRNKQLEQEMKVVVGTKNNLTPILSDTVRYIVFNPTWNVPPSITRGEMVEKIKADPDFLKRNQYALFKGSYVSGDAIDPAAIDWSKITKDNFPYFLVQKPGSLNALGQVKFLFPNQQNIYLHDTPARNLFAEYSRDFSHGCIRLEQPLDLASPFC